MTRTDAERARRRERRVRWSIRIGTALIRLLAPTWRVRQIGSDAWRARRDAGQSFVLSAWHGDLLSAVWAHRRDGVHMLVSEHSDGEIITQIGAGLGLRAIRGSTSRGGTRALLSIVRALREGAVVGFTPDGPRGPRHEVQGGIVMASQRSEAPIVAIGVAYSGAWTLRSWDQFRIPYPFAKVVMVYGTPMIPGGDDAEAVAEVARLMAAVNEAAAEAVRRG